MKKNIVDVIENSIHTTPDEVREYHYIPTRETTTSLQKLSEVIDFSEQWFFRAIMAKQIPVQYASGSFGCESEKSFTIYWKSR